MDYENYETTVKCDLATAFRWGQKHRRDEVLLLE